MPNETFLSISEKINILEFLSKTHRKIHEGRIRRELQIVITTLSFYAASLAFKFAKNFPKDDKMFNIIVWVALLGIAVGVFVYMKTSGDANKFNQTRAEVSEDNLIGLLKDSGINVQDISFHPCANRWLWQALIVLFGAIISGFLITYF